MIVAPCLEVERLALKTLLKWLRLLHSTSSEPRACRGAAADDRLEADATQTSALRATRSTSEISSVTSVWISVFSVTQLRIRGDE
jgi:hypothetical protein